MKKRIYSIIFLIGLSIGFNSCHVVRYFWWNVADIGDGDKFASIPIENGETVFDFFKEDKNFNFGLPEHYIIKNKEQDFDQFIEDKKTIAFLVIRNDSIIYEHYVDPISDSTLLPSFSISKSVVSALVGIALNEGYIYSVHEPITKYLPELSFPGFEKITIEHLLNMRSGIRFTEAYYNPFDDISKYYYGRNLSKYIGQLKIKELPDSNYNYIGVNSLLLSTIVERATGIGIAEYLETKIWKKIGMQHPASWNIDSKKHQTVKSFCCINALASDFARFGRLYLNKGNWEGEQIIPSTWVEKSTTIMNDSRDSQDYPYTYQWRVLPNGAYFAKGILGQYLLIYPEKNLIFVRIGKKYGNVDWADFFIELSEQL